VANLLGDRVLHLLGETHPRRGAGLVTCNIHKAWGAIGAAVQLEAKPHLSKRQRDGIDLVQCIPVVQSMAASKCSTAPGVRAAGRAEHPFCASASKSFSTSLLTRVPG
jgi:hypothetical protein